MRRHGPSCLDGPASRDRRRWLAVAPPDPPQDGTPAPLPGGEEPVRKALVERVRREIAEGVYETPDKLEQALDQLFDDLERA
jgi:hypothetical protein